MASEELKELRKEAKELGVEYDKDMEVAELQILVDTAKEAAKAQAEQNGPVGDAPKVDETKTDEVKAPKIKDEDVTEVKETVHITQKDLELVEGPLVKEGVATVVFYVRRGTIVIGEFESLDAGKHYLENVSRF